jgi:hypothetical protein
MEGERHMWLMTTTFIQGKELGICSTILLYSGILRRGNGV